MRNEQPSFNPLRSLATSPKYDWSSSYLSPRDTRKYRVRCATQGEARWEPEGSQPGPVFVPQKRRKNEYFPAKERGTPKRPRPKRGRRANSEGRATWNMRRQARGRCKKRRIPLLGTSRQDRQWIQHDRHFSIWKAKAENSTA